MRRLFGITFLILIALSMTLLYAGAMSNTDRDTVIMAAERALMDYGATASASYSVDIVGINNDINVSIMSPELNKKNFILNINANDMADITSMYILLVNMYPDLGNLNVVYENDKGTVDTAYGLRSWAEQVRKDDNGYGTNGYRYNRDDLADFAIKMFRTFSQVRGILG